MQFRAYYLMKKWCDTLLSYQVNTHTTYTDKALLCPACHVIHGRIADLCFPLTVIWAKTGDTDYLEQADRLIDWSEFNLKTPDGLWYNDVGNHWIGTSAFSAMSIGEAIYHFEDRLPTQYKQKWMTIFLRMMDTVAAFDTWDGFYPVSNYYCGFATALALAWKLTGDVRYYEKSKYWITGVLARFDENGLLYGEGDTAPANDGSRTIDMGYNLEESLPLLLRYAELTGEHQIFFRERLRNHLDFLLPDGAIDNSFGTRHNKWTYWGSRTSDGLVEGLALVLDDPMFADACERVLSLYEACTHHGLLAMPMAHEAGEPTCLHHTFPHAKALAALVCAESVPIPQKTVLPSEENYGIKVYQNGRLLLVSNGVFRATFSACQAMRLPKHASNGGGSMNLLYHKDYGVICAATSSEYVANEIFNEQNLRNSPNAPCMTVQFITNGQKACEDPNVALTSHGMTVTAHAASWQADYTISEQAVAICLTCDDGIYNLPIVCSRQAHVAVSEDARTVTIDNQLRVVSDTPMTVDGNRRAFNQVGGLLYLPISVDVKGAAKLSIHIPL